MLRLTFSDWLFQVSSLWKHPKPTKITKETPSTTHGHIPRTCSLNEDQQQNESTPWFVLHYNKIDHSRPPCQIQGARGSTWWHHKPKHHIYSYNYGHRPDQGHTCLWWQTGEFDGDWCWHISKGEIRGCARLRLNGLLVIRRIFTDLDWF